jgi:sugar phosphate isomerase/epimerase
MGIMSMMGTDDIIRQVSLCWLTIPEAGHVGLIDAASQAGFGAVGMKLVRREGDAIPPLVGDAAQIREVKRAIRITGTGVLEMGAIWLSPDYDRGKVEPALALGAELGALFVIAVGADPDRTRLVENLRDLVMLASGYGISTAIEFTAYTEIRTFADARDVARAVGRPGIKLLLDALHFQRSGGSPAELAERANDEVAIFHLCDAPAPAPADLAKEGRTDRLFPGEGQLPLIEMLRAMPASVRLELEVPCLRLAGSDVHVRAKIAADATKRVLDQLAASQAQSARAVL